MSKQRTKYTHIGIKSETKQRLAAKKKEAESKIGYKLSWAEFMDGLSQ